ncbi:hypothetical protein [Kribbella sp. NBC_00359]|uniref:hypothetical protein n=1 Tax=Kribbella sp. NBC_00359 TaxID=2975966 RepID=UPI002E1BB7F8
MVRQALAKRVLQVRTLDELRKAIATARPGAEIVLANGMYDVPGDESIAVTGRRAPRTRRSPSGPSRAAG